MSARTPSVCKQTQNTFATCTRKGNKQIYLASGVKFIRMPKESEQVQSEAKKTREATITPLLLGQGLCVCTCFTINPDYTHTYMYTSLSLYIYIYLYICIPGTQMTSTFEGQPPPQNKTCFQSKQGSSKGSRSTYCFVHKYQQLVGSFNPSEKI